MYSDIGLRNHAAVQRNGYKLLERWNQANLLGDYRDDALKAMAVKYEELLRDQEQLFKAASLLVNG